MPESDINKEIDLINSQGLSKIKLNNLILNYLIVEGYETSAIDFSREIGLDLSQIGLSCPNNGNNIKNKNRSCYGSHEKYESLVNGLQSIKQRNEIKLLLIKGEISTIISKLNEYYPFLLESNEFLHFKILLLNLVEIIKKHQRESGNNDERRSSFAGRRKSVGDTTKRKRRLSSVSSQTDKKKTRRKSSAGSTKLSMKELKKEEEFFNSIISFVKDKLFSKAIRTKSFLHELELSMCLLLFNFNDFQTGNEDHFLPKELLNLVNNKNFKNEVFNLINNAILNYNSRFLSHNVSVGAMSDNVGKVSNEGEGYGFSSTLLNNDFMNNNERSKYRNDYVFYDTDSDDDSDEESKPPNKDHRNGKVANDMFEELLFEEDEMNDDEESGNDDAMENDLLENHLNNNINSKFKQLINLWMWSENVMNEKTDDAILRVDLERLFSE
ncbi:hypothetical protein DASC09_063780 [Saccharomycopsis crataegensis]|uniref:CTLH domain-containing protein n=1 Tax=Saccharomycopsis crataegensis TaxID=43959 RepID=A0AAV5QWG2_9ASCO|nr:hypothetical protein DASC09_063780 [Saccharomycopsis crataegensis]